MGAIIFTDGKLMPIRANEFALVGEYTEFWLWGPTKGMRISVIQSIRIQAILGIEQRPAWMDNNYFYEPSAANPMPSYRVIEKEEG